MKQIPNGIGLFFAAAASLPSPVGAQRVNDNAVAQAADAFGINVGGENLGLYDPGNVRGFSPTAAGNIRVDGLYVDRTGNMTSRLVNGYRIFVGASVLGHPFPAPSGIADYTIRKPGEHDILSVAANVDDWGSRFVELDAQLHRVLPGLGLAGGMGLYRYDQWYGGTSHTFSSALSGRWKPGSGLEILPFWSRIDDSRDEGLPTLLLQADAHPPRTGHAHRFVGQHWAKARELVYNEGVIANAAMGQWQLRASVFRSIHDIPISYSPLFLANDDAPVAARSMIAERNQSSNATSGEVQLSRSFSEGKRRHLFYLAAWGRDHRRAYGASDVADLTPGPIDAPAFVAEPDFHFGAQTHDHVRQLTVGLAYEGLWTGVGVLNLGIQKTAYQKTVAAPTGELPKSSDRPWLFNASFGLQLLPRLMLYSGISRGLEESDVAPAVATNRSEAPPAIRTRQVDAGLRWTIAPAMTLVAGAFRIEKPYYGLDHDRMFRQLGRIRHQGLELSLAGSPLKGLSIVGGAVRLDASVAGHEVNSGRVGRRPVGSSPLTVIASADYRLPAWQALSVDANFERDGRRIATVDDRLHLPSRALLDLGLRYRLSVLAKPAVLRLQVQNVTNSFSWDVAGSGALQVHQPRQASAKLSVDF